MCIRDRTTIDTLDYSGSGFNEGSKVVVAAAGPAIRELGTSVPSELRLPEGFSNPSVCLPGVLAITAPQCGTSRQTDPLVENFCNQFDPKIGDSFPLIVLVDDAEFSARTLNNFLWTTFTRSDPALDLYGVGANISHKHWGCLGSLVIDARVKPHHAPPLLEDPDISAKVDAMASRGGPLAKFL